MNSKNRKFDIWTLITTIVFLMYILVLVFPLFSLLIKSFANGQAGGFSLGYFTKFFGKEYYYGSLFNSLKVTVSVTLLCALIATPLAYIMATVKIKGRTFIQILILISSMQAPFIGAYSWILLLGRNGAVTNILKKSLGIKVPEIYGFTGILLVLTLQLVPLIYMYVSGALKSVDNSLLEAAESMGCTGIKKMFKVIVPLILPTLLAGALLVFMRALADFGTPMLIGEGYQTVPVLIYNEFVGEVGGDDGFAAAISVVVIIFATAIFLLQKYISNKKSFTMSALHPMEAKKVSGIKNILAHAYIYIFTFIALLPQLCVIYTSFLNTSGMMFTKGYSLNSYRAVFSKIGGSIKNTFLFAAIAIVIVVILAILIAYVTVRRRNSMTNFLDVLTMFPYIVPGSILGIALLISFNKKPILLSGTAVILIIAFTIRRLPYTIRSSAAIMHQISISTEEAAISLGASNLKTFAKITLPIMLPGVISGAILSWITIISELSTSIILYTAKTKTMTIAIYTEVLRGNYGAAACLATILTLVTIISLLIFFKVSGKKEITL
ncbi:MULTISPECIES: ABC transporter permease [Clostridium]|uniref:Iron ABC transporter permease n=1 Tax=Clostridium beijerinckii TaxID=1520 RepID=A0A1S9NC74_CLOBE|nr:MULTISPECIES: iron ABC transporter permease [Clostridium]MBN7573525.1 iron ABC transporter permease [Clostridium beijerinckii]MBN7579132.1 iron ABC transporter permease [Clostridium beijerinckii]MBN7583568.1 iron ABC transporter permease [Clostridium beijerinckii]MBO0519759.1 iron ABC transporter permease [Clostridium beijerinckii]MZK51271.1 ABC transporter permease subunit [Clostridium beijerinckii]